MEGSFQRGFCGSLTGRSNSRGEEIGRRSRTRGTSLKFKEGGGGGDKRGMRRKRTMKRRRKRVMRRGIEMQHWQGSCRERSWRGHREMKGWYRNKGKLSNR
jgi:hypothetical protein